MESDRSPEIARLEEEIALLRKEIEDRDWASAKTNEAIRILYKELEKKNDALKRFDQLKSQFVSNVSHEFKSPLTIIKESVALILDGSLGEVNGSQREMLEVARRTLDRLIRLVRDMLDLSKIEAGKMDLKREEIAIVPLAEEIVATFRTEIEKKGLSLRKEFAPDAGTLWADRDKLTQALINLLSNAVKYTPAKGAVTVRISGTEREVRCEFLDTGPGIPPEYREKIFDKFERITAEKQEGTGLGLPITRDIVTLHKGRIWVEGDVGKGSIFIATFPRDLRT